MWQAIVTILALIGGVTLVGFIGLFVWVGLGPDRGVFSDSTGKGD